MNKRKTSERTLTGLLQRCKQVNNKSKRTVIRIGNHRAFFVVKTGFITLYLIFHIWDRILNHTDENNYCIVCEFVRDLCGERYGKEN